MIATPQLVAVLREQDHEALHRLLKQLPHADGPRHRAELEAAIENLIRRLEGDA